MKHLDLFSGIGGFAYAIDQVWENVEHIFCDNDLFCQAVLKKHWPNSKIYGNIRTLTADTRCDTGIDILTGGFPCQPFSQAGQRRGTKDNRYLWPEMLRIISEFTPEWVIAENVGGLLTLQDGLVFRQVCVDLENESYEVVPFVIPACAVNAPHRRDRVWIVAYKSGERLQRSRGARASLARASRDDTNAPSQRRDNGGDNRQERQIQNDKGIAEKNKSERNEREHRIGEIDVIENPLGERGRGGLESGRQILECESTKTQNARPSWEKNWIEVATQFCSVDDGLPVELGEPKLTKAKHREQQLKAYGNAIVPQVAIKILEAIKAYEKLPR